MPIPENNVPFTGLNTGTVKLGSILATSEPDNQTPPNYDSTKVSVADVGTFIATQQTYQGLNTQHKTLVDAINDAAQGGGGGSSTLAGLTDVNITTPSDGDALVYDAANDEWVNGQGGGGDANMTELTQAEYDALEQAGQLVEDMMYFITDGKSSSDPTDFIDDTTTAVNKVWSSDKVSSELATKQDDLEGGLLSSVDLNDLITNKNYWVSRTSITNTPVDAFGYLEVIRVHTTTTGYICMQRFTRFGADNLAERAETYIRFYSNSQWYSWNKVAEVIT